MRKKETTPRPKPKAASGSAAAAAAASAPQSYSLDAPSVERLTHALGFLKQILNLEFIDNESTAGSAGSETHTRLSSIKDLLKLQKILRQDIPLQHAIIFCLKYAANTIKLASDTIHGFKIQSHANLSYGKRKSHILNIFYTVRNRLTHKLRNNIRPNALLSDEQANQLAIFILNIGELLRILKRTIEQKEIINIRNSLKGEALGNLRNLVAFSDMFGETHTTIRDLYEDLRRAVSIISELKKQLPPAPAEERDDDIAGEQLSTTHFAIANLFEFIGHTWGEINKMIGGPGARGYQAQIAEFFDENNRKFLTRILLKRNRSVHNTPWGGLPDVKGWIHSKELEQLEAFVAAPVIQDKAMGAGAAADEGLGGAADAAQGRYETQPRTITVTIPAHLLRPPAPAAAAGADPDGMTLQAAEAAAGAAQDIHYPKPITRTVTLPPYLLSLPVSDEDRTGSLGGAAGTGAGEAAVTSQRKQPARRGQSPRPPKASAKAAVKTGIFAHPKEAAPAKPAEKSKAAAKTGAAGKGKAVTKKPSPEPKR